MDIKIKCSALNDYIIVDQTSGAILGRQDSFEKAKTFVLTNYQVYII